MPNRPITFKFEADVVKFLNGLDKAELSVEDLEQAFVSASNSSQDLERKISRATKDAERDVEKLERAIKDVPKATDSAADQAVRDFDRLGDAAADAGRETGDEFKQNLGETLSSGGDLQDVLTDTIGGLIGSLKGPVGIAAGVIGAGALLVFNQVKKSWEETQQAIADSADTFWSTTLDNLKGKVGVAAAAVSQTLLVGAEVDRLWREAPDDMAELVKQAELLGINANDVVLARAGDEQAIRRVNDALRQSERETDNYLGATSDVLDAHDNIEQSIFRGGRALDINKARVDAYNASLPEVAEAHRIIASHAEDLSYWMHKSAEDATAINTAFRTMPNDLTIRLHADATELRQYFPYGVGGGGSPAAIAAMNNTYARSDGASP